MFRAEPYEPSPQPLRGWSVKLLTARQAKTVYAWVQNGIGIAMVMAVAVNLQQAREKRDLEHEKAELAMQLIESNAKLASIQAEALKGRGQWMHGDHQWAVTASKVIGIKPPPSPPSIDQDAFRYDPNEAPE